MKKSSNILLPDLEKVDKFQSNEKTTSFKNEIEKLQEYKTKIEFDPCMETRTRGSKEKKSQYADYFR